MLVGGVLVELRVNQVSASGRILVLLIGLTSCDSNSPNIPLAFGIVTATIDGRAWQSHAVGPFPPDSTVAEYAVSLDRLRIYGFGDPPAAGGVVENIALCVTSGVAQRTYSLGPVNGGPFGRYEPADTNILDNTVYFSGTPPGHLSIEELDVNGGIIRGSFDFVGHEKHNGSLVRVEGRFYGRMIVTQQTGQPVCG
jgi:hypothetical protein